MINVFRPERANTPSIASAATVLELNPARCGFIIHNMGTNPLFVLFATGASTSVFHTILAAGTGVDNGTGGSYEQMGSTVYSGKITCAGTSPRYTVTEFYAK